MKFDPSKNVNILYNHLNHPNSIFRPDSSSGISFKYDAFGRLHQRIVTQTDSLTRLRSYFDEVELINGYVDIVHHANGYINLLYSVPEELFLSGVESGGTATYEALSILYSRTISGSQDITLRAGGCIQLIHPYDLGTGNASTLEIQNFVPNDVEYVWVLRDHLNNNRLFFADKNGNGQPSIDEILSVHSYYPGGLPLRQANEENKDFRYRFGDKEELEFTGYLNFGARCLDASTCRFLGTDRFSEKYPWQSPFNYAASNPIKYIDVNGDSIRINGVVYIPGMVYDGEDRFVKSTIQVLNYILDNDADVTGLIKKLASSSENHVDILESNKKNNPFHAQPAAKTFFSISNSINSGKPMIIFHPTMGLQFMKSHEYSLLQVLVRTVGQEKSSRGVIT